MIFEPGSDGIKTEAKQNKKQKQCFIKTNLPATINITNENTDWRSKSNPYTTVIVKKQQSVPVQGWGSKKTKDMFYLKENIAAMGRSHQVLFYTYVNWIPYHSDSLVFCLFYFVLESVYDYMLYKFTFT